MMAKIVTILASAVLFVLSLDHMSSAATVTISPSPFLSALKDKFQHVLVVVKHNSPTKPLQVRNHFHWLSQIFTTIRIYGPWKDEMLHELKFKMKLPVVEMSDDGDWYENLSGSYKAFKPGCIAYEAMVRELSIQKNLFEGYLFMHDDLVLNSSTLIKHDLRFPWTGYNQVGEAFNLVTDEVRWKKKSIENFQWLNLKIGIDALNALQVNAPDLRFKLSNCTGGNYSVFVGKADFFYIPKTEVDGFVQVMSTFAKHRLFLEFAIPSYMECFSVRKPNHLKLCSRPNALRSDSVDLVSQSCSGSDMVHPVKLSNKHSWDVFQYLFVP